MSKITDLVLSDPEVKKYDFKIALFATLCAVASLATKTFLTYSGGSGAIYTIAAGYFAIGGNLVLLSPKLIKDPIKRIASIGAPFLGKGSNFAFILKMLGAVGFMAAGIVEDAPGLALGGAGFAAGNIIALVKGYKTYSVAGYGVAAGAFLSSGLASGNDMLTYAGIMAVFELIFLAIYKHHDENRFELLQKIWEEKRQELEVEEDMQEELGKIKRRFVRGRFSSAFSSDLFISKSEKFFDSKFAKYAHKEKEVEDSVKEKVAN